jgi:hypothetical protein
MEPTNAVPLEAIVSQTFLWHEHPSTGDCVPMDPHHYQPDVTHSDAKELNSIEWGKLKLAKYNLCP